MLRFLLLALLVLMFAVAGVAGMAESMTFYVSPTGSDSWSGKLPGPNKNRTDGPFATLTRARDAVRALKKEQGELKQPVTIQLRKGTYTLVEPLVLTQEDSGSPDCPVVYAAYPGENPVISGGRAITGWKQVDINGRKLWAAEIPDVKAGNWFFRELYADGRRLSRTRIPREGFYRFADWTDTAAGATKWNEGQAEARFVDDNIKNWSSLEDVEVTAFHFWVDSHLPIKSVDEQTKTVTFSKTSVFRLTEDFGLKGARFFVENVFEALDIPGQWYLDRSKGIVYILTSPGQDPNRMAVVAPKLEQLVKLQGNAEKGQFVEHVGFQGIQFSHTQWLLPADTSGSPQAAVLVPGAVQLEGARSCFIRNCTVAHIGNYAVQLEGGSQDNEISSNKFYDLGAGGVRLEHQTRGATVSDNEIYDCGKVYHCAVGVLVGNSGHNRIIHNHIHNLYYTGISVGWRWGYGPSDAVNNEIAYNHIHDVGRGWLSDLAGVYTLGISPGTIIHHNLIHDCYSAGYGGWGIYTDEGSSNILIKDNIVYRTKTGGFHQHYGKNNLIQNNIFALNKQYQLQRTRPEEHISFKLERNIVYFNEGSLLGSNWKDGNFKFDNNVYFDASRRALDFAGLSLEEWKKLGMDAHSVIADPMFADPAKGDFTLNPDSPAIKLGFQPIDLSTVGPRVSVDKTGSSAK